MNNGRMVNEAGYKALRSFIMDEFERKGVDVEQLVQEKLDRHEAYRVNGMVTSKLSHGDAVREVIADGCEMMLRDSSVVERLARENRTLAEKIRDFLTDFVRAVKDAFDHVEAHAKEAAALMEQRDGMLRYCDKLQDMWDSALEGAVTSKVEAADANEMAEALEASDINTTYSLREKDPPKKTVIGYKAFYVRDGKLYPPMVSNISEDKARVSKATSGTMKSMETPVGVWLDADVGGIMVDENGEPVRTKDTKRIRVKNDKSGGDATLAFRPGWHLGEWPDAKQFNKKDAATGERTLMPDDLVFAKCEVSADVDYQLEALSYGINQKGKYVRSQAGLPRVPVDGMYKYRTNVDPTTAPWIIAGSMRVLEILSDEDCAQLCAEHNVETSRRYSGHPINLEEFGLKRGTVTPTGDLERFAKNDASRVNDELLERALYDERYKEAYVTRDIDFSDPAIAKEFEMNGQDVEEYRRLYEAKGRKRSSIPDGYRNLPADAFYTDGHIYDYDFLVAQKDAKVVVVPSIDALMKGGSMRKEIVRRGKTEAAGGAVAEDAPVSVVNTYTGRTYTITNESIKHGLRSEKRVFTTNAQLGLAIGEIVTEGIPINGLHSTDNNAVGTYALATKCIVNETGFPIMAITHIDQQNGNVDSVEFIDMVHSVNGRVYRNNKNEQDWHTLPSGELPLPAHNISIASLLEEVNFTHRSLLSTDVLKHLGEDRPENGFYSESAIFSLRDSVEQTRDLIAVHNLTAENLRGALELGGFPMPSIAIVKAKDGHTRYGDISAVFGRDTVDPQVNGANKVYGADAWTPTNPRVEYQVNSDKGLRVLRRLKGLAEQTDGEYGRSVSNLLSFVHDSDTSLSTEQLVQKATEDRGMKAAYLADKGMPVERITKYTEAKPDGWSEEHASDYAAFKRIMGADFQHAKSIPITELLAAHEAALKTAFPWIEPLYTRQGKVFQANVRLSHLMRGALKYESKAMTEQKPYTDYAAMNEAMDKTIDKADFTGWVHKELDGILGKAGIRSGKAPFTAGGNSRSFNQLHYDYTLENIVKAMQTVQDERGQGLWGATASGMQAVAAKEFKSVDEMHKASGRLARVTEDEFNAAADKVSNQITDIISEVRRTNRAHSKNAFIENDVIGDALINGAQSVTTAAVIRSMKKDGYTVDAALAQQILAMYDAAANLPTEYFEAKPQRAVGFDEIKALIVPDNTDAALMGQLEDKGVNVVPYAAGNEQARLDALNGLEDVRFALRDNILTPESSEEERFNTLKNAEITLPSVRRDRVGSIDLTAFNTKKKSDIEKPMRELARRLGLTNVDLENCWLDFPFLFANKNLMKSLHHQLEYGGTYEDYAKAMTCFGEIVSNAYPIETHYDKAIGTAKAEPDLKQVYVFVSAFRDGNSIVPVQLEVKEYRKVTRKRALYLNVVLTKTAEVVGNGLATQKNDRIHSLLPAVKISLSTLFASVNSKDKSFLKYVPDGFLSTEQKEAKAKALDMEYEKYHRVRAETADEDADADSSFSLRDSFTYESLVRKPDMELTLLTDSVGTLDRRAIISTGLQNVKKHGITGVSNMAAVYVGDAERTVHVSTRSLEHGLDRRALKQSTVIQNIGDMLVNSILINEANAKKETAQSSYVLLGAGREVNGDTTYAVFVVNRFTGELEDFDVLYSTKTKTEPAASKAGASGVSSQSPTDSKISIASLLENVKDKFSDVLPNDVLEHFGIERKATEISGYLHFSLREAVAWNLTDRELLNQMDVTAVAGDAQKDFLNRFHGKQTELNKVRKQLAEIRQQLNDSESGDEQIKLNNRADILQRKADRLNDEMTKMEQSDLLSEMAKDMRKAYERYVKGKTAAKLASDIQAMKAQVNTLKAQKRMADARFDMGDLNSLASELKRSYGFAMSSKDIADKVFDLFTAIKNDPDNQTDAFDRLGQFVQSLVSNATVKDRSAVEANREVLDYFKRAHIGLSDAQWAEVEKVYGSRKAFRDKVMGRWNIVAAGTPGMTTLDMAWNEITDSFPGVFAADTTANDEPIAVADFMDNVKEKTLPAYLGEDATAVFSDVFDALFGWYAGINKGDSNWKAIEQMKHDLLNAEAVLEAEKKQHAQDVAQTLADNRRQLQDERTLRKTAQYELEMKEAESERLNKAIRDKQRELDMAQSKGIQALAKQQQDFLDRMARDKAYRETVQTVGKLRKRIKRNVKWMDDLIRKETDYKNVPEEYKPLAETLVSLFAENDSMGSGVTFSTEKAQKLAAAYAALAEQDGDLAQAMYDEEIMEAINALAEALDDEWQLKTTSGMKRTDKAEDRLRNYQRIDEVVSYIRAVVRHSQDVFIAGKKAAFSQIGGQTRTELESRKPALSLAGEAGKAQDTLNSFIVKGNMTPIYFFKHVSGTLQTLFDDMRKAQNKWAFRMQDTRAFIRDTKATYHYDDWGGEKDVASVFKTDQGRTIRLTREQAMFIYATDKREHLSGQKSRHLEQGGFVYEEGSESLTEKRGLLKVQSKRNSGNRLSANDIAQITATLTDEQKAYADAMVGYMSGRMSEYGNETSMTLYGIKKYKERYYFPFKSVRVLQHVNSNRGTDAKAQDDNCQKHRSFTKRTVKGAATPVVLDDFTKLCEDHMQAMCTYSTMTVPIETMNRVLNWKYTTEDGSMMTIRAAVDERLGTASKKYIEQLMDDLNSGVRVDASEAMVKRMIGLFKKNAVMGSLSVAVQQPAAILRAAVMLDPKYLAKTTFSKHSWNELKQHSGLAIIKEMGRFGTDMGKQNVDWLDESERSFFDKLKRLAKDGNVRNDLLSALPAKADQLAWTHLWNAVKAEQAALHPGMDRASKDFLDLCGERFNDIVDYTQVYDSTLSRSQNMRSKSGLMGMMTSFMAEPTVTLNMLYDAAAQATKKGSAGKVYFVRSLAVFVSTALLTALAESLVTAGRDDDDRDKPWLANYLANTAGNFIDNLNLFNMIPFVRDVSGLVEGYSVDRADMSLFSNLVDAYTKWQQGKTSGWQAIEDLGGGLAAFLGIPLKNIMRDMRTAYNTAQSMMLGMPSADQVKYGVLGELGYDDSKTANYQRYYDAILAGDEGKIAESYLHLSEYLGIDDKTIYTGLTKQVKEGYLAGALSEAEAEQMMVTYGGAEDENKAWLKIREWADRAAFDVENGDTADAQYTYSRYGALYDAVLGGGDVRFELDALTSHGVNEKDARSAIVSAAKMDYCAGTIDRATAKHIITTYGNDSDENDAYWKLKEWDYIAENGSSDGYSKYHDLFEALRSGGSVNTAMAELTAHGDTENNIRSKIVSQVGEWYKGGEIGEAAATSMLLRHGNSTDSNDIYWQMREWDYAKENGGSVGWSKYDRFMSTIDTGSGLKDAARELLNHGTDKSDIARMIAAAYKADYVALCSTNKTKAATMLSRILTAYEAIGYDR